MLTFLLLQLSLCTDRVSDKLPHPMQALVKPVPGQTYTDPAFRTKVTRITQQYGVTGENAVIKPMYSTMPAWNADETLLLLWSRGLGHILYWGEPPYPAIRFLEPFHPTDIEQILWDPIDPNALYYPTNYNALPLLIKQTMNPWEARVIHDFRTPPTNCPVDWGKLLKFGSDPQWMGYGPRKIVGLQCGDRKFLYSITEDKVLAFGNAASPNAPIEGPSEGLCFFEGYVLDNAFHMIRRLGMVNPGEHASMGRDDRGDTWNAVAYDGTPDVVGSLVSWVLGSGAMRVVVGPASGWPYPPSSTHLSAIAVKAPGWVAVGGVGGIPWGQGVLQNELILANTSTGEVCRLAHVRTKAGADCGANGKECPWGYWGETHVNISPSGTRVLFGSDWMGSESVDTYVIDLRN